VVCGCGSPRRGLAVAIPTPASTTRMSSHTPTRVMRWSARDRRPISPQQSRTWLPGVSR
jgi:hypothetical protein